MKKKVRQDINFLENPIWLQKKSDKRGYVYEKNDYTLKTAESPPTRQDVLILYYLMWVSQEKNWENDLYISHYEVLKNVGLGQGGNQKKRLRESLNRWAGIVIDFKGSFYDGKTYKNLVFHIIDSWEQEEGSRLLKISFSKKWLLQIENSSFFEMLTFEELRKLKTSLSTRLYEVLVKSFHSRSVWKIDAKKLASKIPMEERYPSSIERKVRPALRKIQERTELYVELEVEKKERGKVIFVFRKKTKPALFVGEKQIPKTPSLLSKVRKTEKKTARLKGVLTRGFEEYGEPYILRQILYANEHAESNYPAFLERAIKKDWGTEWKQAQEKAEQAKVQQKEERKQEEEKQRQQEKAQEKSSAFQTLAKQQWETMSKEAREELRQTVLNKYPQYQDPENPFAQKGLKLQVLNTLAQQIEKTFLSMS